MFDKFVHFTCKGCESIFQGISTGCPWAENIVLAIQYSPQCASRHRLRCA